MKRRAISIFGMIIGVTLLASAYYLISPFFRNVKVDEALPEVKDTNMQAQSMPVPVMGTAGHPASGTARVIVADGRNYIRYENFKTINGPDIYVYLAKDLGAKEFVNLGTVKATEGNINYEIPSDVNVTEYPYVLTWCRMFGVLFNHADLAGAR